MKIGFYDSGIGGLSVLNEAFHRLPDEDYIFYADTDHVPYGSKTKEEILGFAEESARFLVDCGVDAIVIACNTATSVAVKTLRQKYDLPIISMEPAVKPAVEHSDKGRVLVIATPVTLREKKLQELLGRVDLAHRVDLLPMPELVGFAEAEQFGGPEVRAYLDRRFGSVFSKVRPEDYSALVLGCTHFNYFKDLYREIFPVTTELIDGNYGTVRQLAHRLGLELKPETGAGTGKGLEIKAKEKQGESIEDRHRSATYYTSGRKVTDRDTLQHFLRMHLRLEKMREIV